MHLIERFTRVDADTITYEFTVADPTMFTRPWSVAVPMTKTEGPLFEFACHEGNAGIVGMLSGARAEEHVPTIEVPGDVFDVSAHVPLKATAAAYGGARIDKVEFAVNGAVVGVDRDAPYQATWTAGSNGRYVVTATVHDSEGRKALSVPVTVFVGVRALERSIAQSGDDAEELPDGSMYLNSSDLELIDDPQRGEQVVDLRFTNIEVPHGAKINTARVQFTVDDDDEPVATELVIRGELAADTQPFRSAARDVSSRRRTAASVGWSPGPWTIVGERGQQQQTPDLSALIEEIVALPGWREGNALALIIRGSGHRAAVSFDGNPTGAPVLYIELAEDRP